MQSPIGKTQDMGFQVGARKTFDISVTEAWDYLFSMQGLKIWLGDIAFTTLELKKYFKLKDGTTAKITTFKSYSHLRMKWQKASWENESILQTRVIEAKEKSTISFHQEKLADSVQREEMRVHWKDVLGKIAIK